ncbi:MAG: hypothetical protein R3C43_19310 [Chloroflexota bacterium]
MEPNENNIDIYGEDDTIDQLVDEMYRAASRGIGDDDAPATHRALDAIVVLSAVLSGISSSSTAARSSARCRPGSPSCWPSSAACSLLNTPTSPGARCVASMTG